MNKKRIVLPVGYRFKELAKAIPTYHWDGKDYPKGSTERNHWSWDVDQHRAVTDIFPQHKQDITDQVKVIKQCSRGNIERVDWLDKVNFKLKPYDYQMEVLKILLMREKYGVFLEMGLGKTKIMIDLVSMLKHFAEPDIKVLVVAPKSIRENWIDEIEKNSSKLKGIVVEGYNREKKMKLLNDSETYKENTFFVTNYGSLMSMFTKMVNVQVRGRWTKVKTIDPAIDPKKFDMVILDESTYIKSVSADRTKFINVIFSKTHYKYILTGTPVTQNLLDLYPQFNFLDEDILGFKTFYSFRNYYCIMGGYNNKEIMGQKNVDELKKKVKQNSIRLLKKQCLPELPPKIYHKRNLEMTKDMKKQYTEMKNDLVIEFQDKEITASIILTKLLRLQEITGGHYLEKIADNKKIEEIRNIIDDYKGNSKFVIWVRFLKSLDIIEAVIKEMGLKYWTMYGETTGRQQICKDFNSNDGACVLIGQVRTGGMGLNIQSGNIVMYYENTFSWQDRAQSEDRSHRSGTKNVVNYIDLAYKNTIDQDVLEALKFKEKSADHLVDKYRLRRQ